MSLGNVSGQNTTVAKNVAKSQSDAHLIFGRHLGHQTPS
jgi:hypothetical protein